MVYDPISKRILMFGGTNNSNAVNDLWEYDYEKNTWREISLDNKPEARQMHGLIYNSAHEVLILFGGRRAGGGAFFEDTREYNLVSNQWKKLICVNHPPVSDHVNLRITLS